MKHSDAAQDKKMINKAIKSYAKKDKAEDKKMMKSMMSKRKKK